jgi:hypothetical protein
MPRAAGIIPRNAWQGNLRVLGKPRSQHSISAGMRRSLPLSPNAKKPDFPVRENRLLGFAPLNEAGMGWIWACLAPERCLYGNLRVRRSSHRQRSGALWAYTIRVEPGGPDASASGWRRGLCAWMTFTLHNRALPPRPEGAKDWFKPLRSRADSRHVGCAPQRQMTHPLRLFTLAVVDVAGYSYTMARGCIRRHDNCLRN